jgi:hypothetical protein
MMAAYAVAFATVAITFCGSGEALFAIAIATGFAVVFFAVPLVMTHIRARHDTRWHQAGSGNTDDRVATYTGPIDRAEAVLHMVIVPLAMSVAFIAFAIIWVLVRA